VLAADDFTWATTGEGTLYAVDTSANTISAIKGPFAPGTAFISVPKSDTGVAGYVGTVNLTTGSVTPLGISLTNPKGLLFVPDPASVFEPFARAAYADFLHRAPTSRQLQDVATSLFDGRASRTDVVEGLVHSGEWISSTVQGLYQSTLGRPGDPAGVTYWTDQIRTGARSLADVAAYFYASPEYYSGIGGGTGQTWVQDLPEDPPPAR